MNTRMNLFFAGALLGSLIPAFGADKSQPHKIMKLSITSTAFSEGQPISQKYTCQGSDISPPLAWIPQGGTPAAIKSFALIMDDPDAPIGTWVHWVLYDLPATVTGLPENTPKSQELLNGAKQGLNSWPRLGYGGPCPPPGKPHRYFFKLYALDTMLNLKPGATKKDVEAAMKGHVLAEGQLMGTYQRK
jgi:Raf kinase inhibitor-like YbhB/YbcL family protein